MSKTIFKNILLLNILFDLSRALVVRNQVPQSAQQQLTFTQNSIEEPRFSARTSKDLKEKTTVIYDPVNDLNNQVLDNFDHRYPDGSYEYRYELADGQARYERGYFIKVNKQKSLVVVGYYSYRMPNGNYVTVFYNADRHGYRQNQAITRDALPNLPRTIDVPQFKDEQIDDLETTIKPKLNTNYISTTTKRSHI